MSNTLIIGYGNTLRGDDAAGVKAAELIAQRHPEFEYTFLHQLVPELAEQIGDYDIVFFIDAQKDITQPIARLITPGIEPGNKNEQPRTHFISPESLLSLSLQLFQRIPSKAYVIGIPASKFEFSEELSAQTGQGVAACLALVEQLIRKH
jgi:hydrogenase maturation protease